MAKVFSTHPVHRDVEHMLKSICNLQVASSPDQQTIMAEGLQADVILVSAPIPQAYFSQATQLRAAVRHGTGLDMIPMQAATQAGVIVANAPGANAASVAEYVIFTAIGLLRRFRQTDAALRQTGWQAGRAFSDQAHDLGGRRLGIVGFGNIGRALASLAQAFGMPVAATTRRPTTLPANVQPMGLDDLVAHCDVLVLCCPLTEATRGLISAAQIARMKPEALLINVARGPLIDTQALIAALAARRIGGAALDVFDVQPLPPDHPLFGFDNVILTPHVAALTDESMYRMGETSAQEVGRILAGEFPLNFCNPEVKPLYRRRFPVRKTG